MSENPYSKVTRIDQPVGVVYFGDLILTIHRDSASYELLIEANEELTLIVSTAADEVARLEL